MLDGREGERPVPSDPGAPRDPVDAQLFALHVATEMATGASREQARASALAAIGERDAAAAAIAVPTPPAMDPALFGAHLRRLTGALRAASRAAQPQRLEEVA